MNSCSFTSTNMYLLGNRSVCVCSCHDYFTTWKTFECVDSISQQGEYEQEGVEVTHVSYEDNRPLLELLLTVSGRRNLLVWVEGGWPFRCPMCPVGTLSMDYRVLGYLRVVLVVQWYCYICEHEQTPIVILNY